MVIDVWDGGGVDGFASPWDEDVHQNHAGALSVKLPATPVPTVQLKINAHFDFKIIINQ